MLRTPTPDPRGRFGPVARAYDRGRPGYPPALVDWVLEQAGLPARCLQPAGPERVADIGCGTGIAARLFSARGYAVVGVDPDEAMLERARAAAPAPPGRVRYQPGEAAATGLGDGRFALVSVAQALHWFELPAALAEFRRLLAPRGVCAAYWNERCGRDAFHEEYEQALRRHCSQYTGRGRVERVLGELRSRPEVVGLVTASFTSAQALERTAFFDRVHSSSYVAHGVGEPAELERELERLFERHQRQGRVTFAYEALALAWRCG